MTTLEKHDNLKQSSLNKNQEDKMYVIQGIFFQEKASLGIGFNSELRTEAICAKKKLVQFLFAGKFGETGGPVKFLFGEMVDQCGWSTLNQIKLTGDNLSFEKNYSRRNYQINYSLHRLSKDRPNDVFVGKYASETTGSGLTVCVIKKINDNLYDYREEMHHLNSDGQYTNMAQVQKLATEAKSVLTGINPKLINPNHIKEILGEEKVYYYPHEEGFDPLTEVVISSQ